MAHHYRRKVYHSLFYNLKSTDLLSSNLLFSEMKLLIINDHYIDLIHLELVFIQFNKLFISNKLLSYQFISYLSIYYPKNVKLCVTSRLTSILVSRQSRSTTSNRVGLGILVGRQKKVGRLPAKKKLLWNCSER